MLTQYGCVLRPPVGAVPWCYDGAGIGGGSGCCQARLHHQVQWHQCWCEYFLPPRHPSKHDSSVSFIRNSWHGSVLELNLSLLIVFPRCFVVKHRLVSWVVSWGCSQIFPIVLGVFSIFWFHFKAFYQCLCNGQSLHRKGLTSFLDCVDQITQASLTHC